MEGGIQLQKGRELPAGCYLALYTLLIQRKPRVRQVERMSEHSFPKWEKSKKESTTLKQVLPPSFPRPSLCSFSNQQVCKSSRSKMKRKQPGRSDPKALPSKPGSISELSLFLFFEQITENSPHLRNYTAQRCLIQRGQYKMYKMTKPLKHAQKSGSGVYRWFFSA